MTLQIAPKETKVFQKLKALSFSALPDTKAQRPARFFFLYSLSLVKLFIEKLKILQTSKNQLYKVFISPVESDI